MFGKEITREEAERTLRERFLDCGGIPPICAAGSRQKFRLDHDAIRILDADNDTEWHINLSNGFVAHCGTGRGCYYTDPERWFTPAK